MVGAAPAFAQDDPTFCPNRPSLGSSACITAPGHVQLELSALDWQRDDTSDKREDTILAGDFEARFGVAKATELQLSWAPVGRVRTRDKATGLIDTTTGIGDVRLGLRQNFRNPDGKGLSFGAEPFVTLPVGRDPVGAGDWGAGIVLPVTYEVSEKVQLSFTGEGDAAVDDDGDGRHLAYSGIVGVGYSLTETVTATAELFVLRDDDPMGHHTETATAGSVAWQPRKNLQLHMLAVAGLNHDTPDVRVVSGGAVLF
ncbi:transporter [Sphingomonas sp. PP-CE-1G-424]|uniref:transporter n=1 Tax=Sphingomonas sp. PP-CE-1G-424 TaxID=2135658 RepID=UPI0010D7A41E|nr:transporter [Sphingomonas sp. PP-CE-1G-424]TCP72344.1 outer membrane putative beta-barrel porin/alpha-amylase [Sphingomonas sp. PP-CE-1G-424]